MAPSQNGPGQEGIKFNQCAGLIFHETGKAEGDGGQRGQGTPSTIPQEHSEITVLWTLKSGGSQDHTIIGQSR